MADNEKIVTKANAKGIFGFNLSNNNSLDLLNLVILASSGIFIKIFFEANSDEKNGNSGPALTTIWGYGLTALALFLMMFMGIYMDREINKKNPDSFNNESNNDYFNFLYNSLLNSSIPILLTFFLLIYAIYINFINFNEINTGRVSDSYSTYSFYSSILIIIQLILIFKYMYLSFDIVNGSKNKEDHTYNKQILFIKCGSFILSFVNIIFLMIQHILLSFYSTDG